MKVREPDRPKADLVAFSFDDASTAAAAESELGDVRSALAGPEASAVVVREGGGSYSVLTHHHPMPEAAWGTIWGLLFDVIFYVPVLGMTVGPGLRRLVDRAAAIGLDPRFVDGVRGVVQPGTSALFLVTDGGEIDAVAEALGAHGGEVMTTPLSSSAVLELSRELYSESSFGGPTGVAPGWRD